ncbi:MAG: molecular chaperone TorD family protein [Desulfobulbaceae bacterium]|nr:molecular chaperone TorD family protein [Desulfobulbaceae bacterium]
MTTTSAISLAEVYRFLAHAMQYPERSWFGEDFLSLFCTFLDELGWDADRAALAFPKQLSSKDIELLQVDYTRLFINSVPHVLAPPYGSFYLAGGGILYGASAEKTRNFYREHGFDLALASDIPDSLTNELQFLSFLRELGEENVELEFTRTHFRPWFCKFSTIVQREANTPYYKAVVKMIDFFTMEDE